MAQYAEVLVRIGEQRAQGLFVEGADLVKRPEITEAVDRASARIMNVGQQAGRPGLPPIRSSARWRRAVRGSPSDGTRDWGGGSR